MRDQATELRNLVLRSLRDSAGESPRCPNTILVLGGGQGVGATTVAMRLAMAWANLGDRLVLVDAHPTHGQIAQRFGLPSAHTITDILTTRRSIHEVLERGPTGVQVLPGRNAVSTLRADEVGGQQRLLEQIRSLDRHADAVLIDAGTAPDETMRRWWRAANEIVIVTLPDSASVMNTYAVIKALRDCSPLAKLRLVVNQVPGALDAADVHRRIGQSCRRFLQLDIELLGSVPYDLQLANIVSPIAPNLLENLDFENMAALLAESISSRPRTPARLAA